MEKAANLLMCRGNWTDHYKNECSFNKNTADMSFLIMRAALMMVALHASGVLVACAIPLAPLSASFPALMIALMLLLLGCISFALLRGSFYPLLVYLVVLVAVIWYTRGVSHTHRLALTRLLDAHPPGVALVTGSTGGIGLEIASLLVARRWSVFLHGRSVSSMRAARGVLAARHPGAESRLLVVDSGGDLSSLRATRAFASAVSAHPLGERLQLLVCNAGIQKQPPGELSEDGVELMLQVNVLSHALLQGHFASERLTVVHVSSLSHRSYSPSEPLFLRWDQPEQSGKRYGRTKLLQIAYAGASAVQTVSAAGHAQPRRVVSVHPGGCATRMVSGSFFESPYALPEALHRLVAPVWQRVAEASWFPPEHCAAAVLAAAFSSEHSGGFFAEFHHVEEDSFFDAGVSERMAERVFHKIQLQLVQNKTE